MAEDGEAEADNETSEWENREREEHVAQMAEEARLGGEEEAVILFSFVRGGGGFLSHFLSQTVQGG